MLLALLEITMSPPALITRKCGKSVKLRPVLCSRGRTKKENKFPGKENRNVRTWLARKVSFFFSRVRACILELH